MVLTARQADTGREFPFSDEDFAEICTLIHRELGIHLTPAKRELVYGRLVRRLRALGLPDFRSYCRLLDETPETELRELGNAISTNMTSFFRGPAQFALLREQVWPALRARYRAQRWLRIWSAGCASGEECYSIAACLLAAEPALAQWNWRILATDIDERCLHQGREGSYPIDQWHGLPESARRFFLRGRGRHAGQMRASRQLRQRITFRYLNLMGEWPMHGPLPLIFCRNVIIYFDKPTQRRLVARIAALQPPGGYLFLGQSESLLGVSEDYRPVGQSIYQRRAPADGG